MSSAGTDLSAVPRMSAGDLVSGALRGLELGETVIAPGVEDDQLLHDVFTAHRAGFGGQSPAPARRALYAPPVDVGVPVAIRLTGKSLGEGVETRVPDDHAAFGSRPP